tara:strand:+ start:107 stop:589 length:483 start_codon:yes stop_codon:yes gene_type:complete
MFLVIIFLSHLLCGTIILEEQESKEYTVTVDSTNLRFYPNSLTINEGDSVRFMWGGEFLPHNSVEENGVFDSGEPAREVDYLYTFDFEQAGVYNFLCEPHESVGMDGTITVLDKIQSQNTDVLSSEDGENNISPVFIGGGFLFIVLMLIIRTRVSDLKQL